MSDVVYTVLVSPATLGPWGDHRLAPAEVATLYVGGSATWAFTNLHGRPGELTVRPADPDSEAGALLVGLAAGYGNDGNIRQALQERPTTDGSPAPIHASGDRDLIDAARQSLHGKIRLSFTGEELTRAGAATPRILTDLDDFDVEVLVPVSN